MWGILTTILFLIICIVTVKCEPQVPCYFIFGDSLSDVGNNNGLRTLAKANYSPYGIDFPGGIPTGRFSNGRSYVDRLTELIGFSEYILPFSTAKGQQILKGVNYASGSAGIRQETGQQLGARISMDQQLVNHIITIVRLTSMIRGSVQDYLGKCLYTVNIGSNDYINNYFLPQYYISSRIYTPEKYADVLIDQYSRQLKTLYSTGARKVAVFGLGLIGCTPAEIGRLGTINGSPCVDKINIAAQLFNQRLINLVDELKDKLPGAMFTYIGSGSVDTGSLVADAPCCELRDDYQCRENGTICPDRNNYVFWDGFHPTELVNIFTAERAYNAANPDDVHPTDIKTLVSS